MSRGRGADEVQIQRITEAWSGGVDGCGRALGGWRRTRMEGVEGPAACRAGARRMEVEMERLGFAWILWVAR